VAGCRQVTEICTGFLAEPVLPMSP
jgi:hypothetical protein